jgi:hypothetical protein
MTNSPDSTETVNGSSHITGNSLIGGNLTVGGYTEIGSSTRTASHALETYGELCVSGPAHAAAFYDTGWINIINATYPDLYVWGYSKIPQLRLTRSSSSTLGTLTANSDQDTLSMWSSYGVRSTDNTSYIAGTIVNRQLGTSLNAIKSNWEINSYGGQGHPNGKVIFGSDSVYFSQRGVQFSNIPGVGASAGFVCSDASGNISVCANTNLTDWSSSTNQVGWSSSGLLCSVQYAKSGNKVDVFFQIEGTSNSILASIDLPYANNSSSKSINTISVLDNGVCQTGSCYVNAGSSTLVLSVGTFGSVFTWNPILSKHADGQITYYTN